jgi:hypothetical protein
LCILKVIQLTRLDGRLTWQSMTYDPPFPATKTQTRLLAAREA